MIVPASLEAEGVQIFWIERPESGSDSKCYVRTAVEDWLAEAQTSAAHQITIQFTAGFETQGSPSLWRGQRALSEEDLRKIDFPYPPEEETPMSAQESEATIIPSTRRAPLTPAAAEVLLAAIHSTSEGMRMLPIPEWDLEKVVVEGIVPPVGTPTRWIGVGVLRKGDHWTLVRRFVGFRYVSSWNGGRIPEPPDLDFQVDGLEPLLPEEILEGVGVIEALDWCDSNREVKVLFGTTAESQALRARLRDALVKDS